MHPFRRLPILAIRLLAAIALLGGQVTFAAPSPPGGVVPSTEDLSRPQSPIPSTDTAPLQAPPAPELGKPDTDVEIDVTAYTVADDAPASLKAALPGLTAPFIGRGRTFEDLTNAASEVTRYLQRDLGYYLGYAYIGPQTPSDGVILISILEGRLDHVQLNWPDGLPVSRSQVEGYLSALQPGMILTVRDVERAVFLINDLRGVSAVVEVKAGARPGTAILEVTPKADAAWNARVDADINGSSYLGKERLGATLTRNSPFGRGDGLAVTALRSAGDGLEFALLGYNTPLGTSGLKVGASFSALKYRLDKADFPLGLTGDGRSISAFALYPWVRSRNLNAFLIGTGEHNSNVDRIAGLATPKRINDGTIGLTGDFRDAFATGAVNTFEVTAMRGRLSFPNGVPSGLDDAPGFTKLDFAFTRLQNLVTAKLLAFLSVHGQYSLDNLDTTEQFRAGGPDDVRAFAPGEGTGDSGVVGTFELRWLPVQALDVAWARDVSLGAFIDAAEVQFRHDPNLIARDPTYRNEAGYSGAGISLVWAHPGLFSLRASLAKPIHGKATSSPPGDAGRLYMQGSWFF